jgi:hypothetical protein
MRTGIISSGAAILFLSALMYLVPVGESATWASYGMVVGAVLLVAGYVSGEVPASARTSADPYRRLYDIDDEEPVMKRKRI